MRLAIIRKLNDEILIEYDTTVFIEKIEEAFFRKLGNKNLFGRHILKKEQLSFLIEDSFREVYEEIKRLTIKLPNLKNYQEKYIKTLQEKIKELTGYGNEYIKQLNAKIEQLKKEAGMYGDEEE